MRALTRNIAGNGTREARGRSVGEAHLLRVAQFVQVGVAGQLHHWGRPTEKQQHVVPRGRQVLLDHVRSHKALAVGPICSGEERREQSLQTHAGKGCRA